MANVLIGSEALARGALTRGQLRWNYQSIFPDVYIANAAAPGSEHRVVGAWLWSRRRGVIAGVAAAALHGGVWVDESAPVEMIWRCGRPPPGIVVRNERITSDEIVTVDGISVTTPERTAMDLARHLPRDSAVCHLDALAQATGIGMSDVLPLIDRYPGVRGVRRAVIALSLMDAGSLSARESQVRLALVDGGFPAPKTRIRVADGEIEAFIDMGYEAPMVGVVCGRQPPDILVRMGWTIIHALETQSSRLILYRVRTEILRCGYSPSRLAKRA